jgi:signal transduction histidine kinase
LRGTAVRLLVWAGGAALCATLTVGALHGGWPPADKAVISYALAFAVITLDVVVWHLRPESRTGLLLAAFAFVGLLGDLWFVFPRSAPAVTVGLAAYYLPFPIFGHLILSYPTGRFTSRIDRWFVGVGYAMAVGYALPLLLFYSPRAPHYYSWAIEYPDRADPLTHVAWHDVIGTWQFLDRTVAVFAVVGLTLLARKLVRSTPGGRRVVLPLALAAAFAGVQFIVQIAVYGDQINSWIHPNWFWIITAAELATPVALAAGMLWGRTARARAADLVVELERTPPGSVRDALARTLGDPSLELALWLPDRGAYVDGDGRPIALPEPGSGRAVTILGSTEAPVAALVHDPVLLERRALLSAAGAAARLALENERLQAELRAQLAELRASRARIVTAGDEERRRLERDLHDGAQQRLLSLGLALHLAREELGPDANGASDILAEADGELRAAIDELRELAHGIHPAVLTEQGLVPALTTLAERSPVPVTIVDLPEERLPAPAESAAYFLVSEALANVAKYAQASRARVSVSRVDGCVLVEVDDDGIGGADPSRGSGLRGLADRVQALDGRLEVTSPAGSGTHLHAEIPCA